jgi:hypothetical protein
LHCFHVHGVHVRALLAIYFHVDKVPIHDRRDIRILERLVRHDVAPVAGGIADTDEKRLVLARGALEGLRAVRIPVNRIAGMLE